MYVYLLFDLTSEPFNERAVARWLRDEFEVEFFDYYPSAKTEPGEEIILAQSAGGKINDGPYGYCEATFSILYYVDDISLMPTEDPWYEERVGIDDDLIVDLNGNCMTVGEFLNGNC